MTVYTALPTDDQNLAVEVTESNDMVTINISPATVVGGGSVTSVGSGTGLTGGPITTTGTLNVDVGTTANKIVQLDSSAKLPAVDGSNLTNLPGGGGGSGTVTSIIAGTGLSGGTITTTGTVAIDSTVATLDGAQALTNKTGSNSQWTNDEAYLKANALTPYSTTAQVSALPVSTFTNDAGYITTQTDSQTLSFADPILTISGSLSTVDLSALNTTTLAWSAITGTPTTISGYGITDAFDGAYSSLTGTPTIPTNNNQLTNGAGYTTATGDVTLIGTQTLTNKTLTSPVLGGTTTSASGNIVLDPASQIVEIKGDGASVEGQIKLNCHVNTHGQTIKAQPHSATITNTMLLPLGADSTLVSEATVDGLVDTHLNTSAATSSQVLSWSGTDYTWVTAGGGGATDLDSLTDVDIVSVQNNDLLMYNSVASKWQNTNLGVSVTPTLTGDSSAFAGIEYVVTISNNATYQDPAYFCEVYTGGTLVVANSAVTNNGDGTLTFAAPATGTHEIRVRCQDFGDLQSEIATKALTTTAFGGTFRYWRVANFLGSPTNMGIKNIRFHSGSGQTGTPYPSNMTSNNTPTPFVIDSSYFYNGNNWRDWNAFDSTVGSWWWTLGGGNQATMWIEADLGSATSISSLEVGPWYSAQPSQFQIFASNTGAFSGEETTIATVTTTGGASTITNVYTLG